MGHFRPTIDIYNQFHLVYVPSVTFQALSAYIHVCTWEHFLIILGYPGSISVCLSEQIPYQQYQYQSLFKAFK